LLHYENGIATITVIETRLNDQSRILMQRDLDGHTWSMQAWLMRLVLRKRPENARLIY
jgi:hypothetical protein